VGVVAWLEGGFAGGLNEVIEVGDEGVKVVRGHLAGAGKLLEGLLPVIFEFWVRVVTCWGRGWDKVEASDWVEGQR
jgi:hypothetical protein